MTVAKARAELAATEERRQRPKKRLTGSLLGEVESKKAQLAAEKIEVEARVAAGQAEEARLMLMLGDQRATLRAAEAALADALPTV